ncbi:MAG: tRNA (guanosine(46)-N7)-methyltransferase TrmB [Nevskiales bacterium]|nr:tRNA (guanosine(46)-N7)-methyltransferase TrmB [Nevskiales bacterium]
MTGTMSAELHVHDRSLRRVRSFVRREGRMTPAQARALQELWPRFAAGGSSVAGVLNLAQVFGRAAPVVLEVGFGNGDHLLARAQAEPEKNFLGVEVHRPGLGHLLRAAAAVGITNLRVLCADAMDVLQDRLPESGLSEVVIYFPDPWPKKRHHKRRLVQAEFARLLASRLQHGGLLHLATDWADYAEHMRLVLNAEPLLQNLALDRQFVPRPAQRPVTKFERRGTRLGHAVFDLSYEKTGDGSRESGVGGQESENDG